MAQMNEITPQVGLQVPGQSAPPDFSGLINGIKNFKPPTLEVDNDQSVKIYKLKLKQFAMQQMAPATRGDQSSLDWAAGEGTGTALGFQDDFDAFSEALRDTLPPGTEVDAEVAYYEVLNEMFPQVEKRRNDVSKGARSATMASEVQRGIGVGDYATSHEILEEMEVEGLTTPTAAVSKHIEIETARDERNVKNLTTVTMQQVINYQTNLNENLQLQRDEADRTGGDASMIRRNYTLEETYHMKVLDEDGNAVYFNEKILQDLHDSIPTLLSTTVKIGNSDDPHYKEQKAAYEKYGNLGMTAQGFSEAIDQEVASWDAIMAAGTEAYIANSKAMATNYENNVRVFTRDFGTGLPVNYSDIRDLHDEIRKQMWVGEIRQEEAQPLLNQLESMYRVKDADSISAKDYNTMYVEADKLLKAALLGKMGWDGYVQDLLGMDIPGEDGNPVPIPKDLFRKYFEPFSYLETHKEIYEALNSALIEAGDDPKKAQHVFDIFFDMTASNQTTMDETALAANVTEAYMLAVAGDAIKDANNASVIGATGLSSMSGKKARDNLETIYTGLNRYTTYEALTIINDNLAQPYSGNLRANDYGMWDNSQAIYDAYANVEGGTDIVNAMQPYAFKAASFVERGSGHVSYMVPLQDGFTSITLYDKDNNEYKEVDAMLLSNVALERGEDGRGEFKPGGSYGYTTWEDDVPKYIGVPDRDRGTIDYYVVYQDKDLGGTYMIREALHGETFLNGDVFASTTDGEGEGIAPIGFGRRQIAEMTIDLWDWKAQDPAQVEQNMLDAERSRLSKQGLPVSAAQPIDMSENYPYSFSTTGFLMAHGFTFEPKVPFEETMRSGLATRESLLNLERDQILMMEAQNPGYVIEPLSFYDAEGRLQNAERRGDWTYVPILPGEEEAWYREHDQFLKENPYRPGNRGGVR